MNAPKPTSGDDAALSNLMGAALGTPDTSRSIPPPVEQGDAQDRQQARYQMNSALCGFSMRWISDGDYMRCRKCKRPHIASAMEVEFNHADGCKAAGNVETHPWRTFVELLAPLMTRPAPAAGDAQDAARYRGWRDAMIADSAEFRQSIAAALPKEVGDTRPPTASEWDVAIDAAIAAQPRRESEELIPSFSSA